MRLTSALLFTLIISVIHCFPQTQFFSKAILDVLYSIPDYQPNYGPGLGYTPTEGEVVGIAADEMGVKAQIEYGMIDGEEGISTADELVIIAFIKPHTFSNKKLQVVFAREFPRNKDGANKVLLLLVYRRTSTTDYTGECFEKAVKLIEHRTRTLGYPVTLSALAHKYRPEVENKFKGIFERELARPCGLSEADMVAFFEPFVAWTVLPTLENEKSRDQLAAVIAGEAENNPMWDTFREHLNKAVQVCIGEAQYDAWRSVGDAMYSSDNLYEQERKTLLGPLKSKLTCLEKPVDSP